MFYSIPSGGSSWIRRTVYYGELELLLHVSAPKLAHTHYINPPGAKIGII